MFDEKSPMSNSSLTRLQQYKTVLTRLDQVSEASSKTYMSIAQQMLRRKSNLFDRENKLSHNRWTSERHVIDWVGG